MPTSLPALALAVGLAAAAAPESGPLPFGPGERLGWELRYLGVLAGFAWAEVEDAGDGRVILRGGARNAPWYAAIYTLDDLVESLWDPAAPGSSRYVTRFREGGFHQDQRMEIAPDEVRVARRQRFHEGWREWEDRYPGPARPVEDPQSAFYRLRTLPLVPGERYRFPVFSGRETWDLDLVVEPPEVLRTALGERRVLPVRLFTRHHGDLEQRGRIVVYVTDDARRLPVRAVLHTNFGAVRADLTTCEPTCG
jgi:hypothetical protein